MIEIAYNEFINSILNTRGRFNCGNEYCERHHIVPKCLGGDNGTENLIDLYAREHFIAHKLLAQENPENEKLICAWWRMCNIKNKRDELYEPTPEEYEEARKCFAQMASQRMMGENNPNYGKSKNKGKSFTEEHKKKLSDVRKGKYTGEKNHRFGKPSAMRGKCHSDETRQKQSEAAKASWTEERRTKQSGGNNSMFGKSHTEEIRAKISTACKNSWTEDRRKQKSEEAKASQSGENHPMWGKHHTEEARQKISQAKIGIQSGDNNPNAKQVIRLSDGKVYACGKYAAEENAINYQTFKGKCARHDGFMYYDEWLTLQNDLKQSEV